MIATKDQNQKEQAYRLRRMAGKILDQNVSIFHQYLNGRLTCVILVNLLASLFLGLRKCIARKLIQQMIVQYPNHNNNTRKYQKISSHRHHNIWESYGSQCIQGPQPPTALKSHKLQKSGSKNSKLFDIGKKSGSTLRRYSSQIEEDPIHRIFLTRYKILPNKQRSHRHLTHKFTAFGEECRNTEKIKYKKIQKLGTQPSGSKNKSRNFISIENRRHSSKDSNGISIFLYNNQNQRSAYDHENCTHLMHESLSTRTPTQPNFLSKESIEDPYFFPRDKQRTKSKLSKMGPSSSSLYKQPPKKVLIEQAYKNMIPQQYESSQSKTNKNLSSISLHTKSGKSMKSVKSIKSSIKDKSVRSIMRSSLKSSYKSHKSSIKNSIFLPISSISGRNGSKANPEEFSNMEELEGFTIIQSYLELLNILANYAHEITQNYQNTEDWQQLIFLTYKKYYLMRVKFFNALMFRNTLFFQYQGIKLPSSSKKSLKQFMNSSNGQQLRKQIFKQNIQILDSLRNIYNLAIEKSGNYINMEQNDNFSCQIYRLIVQEIEQLKDNYYRQPEIVKGRLKNVVRCVTAIAKLDRKWEEEKYINQQIQKPMTIQIFQKIINLIRDRLI